MSKVDIEKQRNKWTHKIIAETALLEYIFKSISVPIFLMLLLIGGYVLKIDLHNSTAYICKGAVVVFIVIYFVIGVICFKSLKKLKSNINKLE